MKYPIISALILAVLMFCPASAEQLTEAPTTLPVTGAMPVANVTETPSIPATMPPTNAPTAAPTAAPTDRITAALTTIALPPHEQDNGQGVPSDLGIPGESGFGVTLPVTDSSITADGQKNGGTSMLDRERCSQTKFRVDCKILWLNTKRFDYARNCKWTSEGCKVDTELVSDATCLHEKTFFWDNFVILYAQLNPDDHC
jgi:hypothetical protein